MISPQCSIFLLGLRAKGSNFGKISNLLSPLNEVKSRLQVLLSGSKLNGVWWAPKPLHERALESNWRANETHKEEY